MFHFNKKAQSTLEFTFAMIVIVFLIFGMVKVFRWVGLDLADRRYSQDRGMVFADMGLTGDPASQLNSDIDIVQPLSAVYHGKVASGNASQ